MYCVISFFEGVAEGSFGPFSLDEAKELQADFYAGAGPEEEYKIFKLIEV